jgi:hypothetical protein
MARICAWMCRYSSKPIDIWASLRASARTPSQPTMPSGARDRPTAARARCEPWGCASRGRGGGGGGGGGRGGGGGVGGGGGGGGGGLAP